jgi:hypothetical protein
MASATNGVARRFSKVPGSWHLNVTKDLMADQSEAVATASPHAPASGALHIAVLAGLASMGTLATNIMLPSLPQMATSLDDTSAAVTSAITIFLAVFALGQLLVDRSRIATADAGQFWSDLQCSLAAVSGAAWQAIYPIF